MATEPAGHGGRKADFIRSQSRATRPFLCPEIELYLVTSACPLWYADEEDVRNMQLADPYWAFAWPGGQALARYVLDHPDLARGKRVLDVGTGGGIVAVAAALAGAARVCGSDIDPLAAEAARLNAELNRVPLTITTRDLVGGGEESWDLVVAGDMCYEAGFTRRLLEWLRRLARSGSRVLLGDPGRGHLADDDLRELAAYRAPIDIDDAERFFCTARVYELLSPDG